MLAVVTIHVLCTGLESNSFHINDINHAIIFFLDKLIHWAVPIFVMISGAVFLNKNKSLSIKNMYIKYIKRLFVNLVTWSIIYSLFRFILKQLTIKGLLFSIIFEQYSHLWYLFMMIGLYMVFPLLKALLDNINKKKLEYLLLLWIIFQILIPEILRLPILERFSIDYGRFNFTFPMGYIGYAILGMYLDKYNIGKKKTISIAICTIIFILIEQIVLYPQLVKLKETHKILANVNNFSIAIFMLAITIFLITKEIVKKINIPEKYNNIILKLSSYTYGIYLVHNLFIILLTYNNINLFTLLNPYLMTLILDIIVILLSIILVFFIKKIKLLKTVML